MIQSLECHSQSDEEPQCTDLQQAFQQIKRSLRVEDLHNGKVSPREPKEQSVTPKMRSKLLAWLQKLALVTFKFHNSTFILAASILNQYLQSVDETPSQLQLVGCTCLFIASKMRQQVIVAPECYATASCNIYGKKQLLQKQRIIYSHIDWKKIKEGVLSGLGKACKMMQMEEKMDAAVDFLCQLMKHERYWEWRKENVVCAVLSLVVTGSKRAVSIDELACLEEQL